MLKEIHEQPRAIEDTLRGRVERWGRRIVRRRRDRPHAGDRAFDHVRLLRRVRDERACGDGGPVLGGAARERAPSTVEIGSEVRYREPVFTKTDLVVAVSQSGETADTLAAVKAARAKALARILAIANVLDSAIPRAADGALYTHAGPEIGVASTKCFTAQLAAMLLLAVYLGRRRSCSRSGRRAESSTRSCRRLSTCAPSSRRRRWPSTSPSAT